MNGTHHMAHSLLQNSPSVPNNSFASRRSYGYALSRELLSGITSPSSSYLKGAM